VSLRDDSRGTPQAVTDLRYVKLDQTTPQELSAGYTPTADQNVATKKYVDDNSSGVGAHSDLSNLDYASAGHTGFQPAGSYLTANQTITLSGDVTGSGETAITATAKANLKIASFGLTVDGSGSACSTGSKGFITIPWAGTITNWYVTGNASGSAVIDLKRSGTSIIGAGNKPTLSSAQRANASVASWTSTAITANDEIEFNLDSCTTCARLNLVIYANRT